LISQLTYWALPYLLKPYSFEVWAVRDFAKNGKIEARLPLENVTEKEGVGRIS
jgi:hypothetical protein